MLHSFCSPYHIYMSRKFVNFWDEARGSCYVDHNNRYLEAFRHFVAPKVAANWCLFIFFKKKTLLDLQTPFQNVCCMRVVFTSNPTASVCMMLWDQLQWYTIFTQNLHMILQCGFSSFGPAWMVSHIILQCVFSSFGPPLAVRVRVSGQRKASTVLFVTRLPNIVAQEIILQCVFSDFKFMRLIFFLISPWTRRTPYQHPRCARFCRHPLVLFPSLLRI